ncbi:hypothetical protein LINGRAHAP2_LOCUS23647 [Linum grandiflorum]
MKLLTRVEQSKLLTKVEKASLLSATKKFGLSLSSIENQSRNLVFSPKMRSSQFCLLLLTPQLQLLSSVSAWDCSC